MEEGNCSCSQETCHDLVKQLSHYIYFSFSFLFLLNLLHRKECGKVSHHKCHESWSHDRMSCHIASHNQSHDEYGKIVHKSYSSCISSIRNLMGTLLNSLCQSLNKEQLALFQLGVQLSYTRTQFHFQSTVCLGPCSSFISSKINPWLVVITITSHLHIQPGPWPKGTLQSVRDCRWRYSIKHRYCIQDLTLQLGGIQQLLVPFLV